jgi:hypothetical protein
VYLSAFDEWEPIRENKKLPALLSDFSIFYPPVTTDNTFPSTSWTLDSLLALPRTRLKYYKRLYGRLLKSTSSGRSDYQLLLAANEKLDRLMNQLETRSNLRAGGDSKLSPPPLPTPESEARQDNASTELPQHSQTEQSQLAPCGPSISSPSPTISIELTNETDSAATL